MSVLSKVHVAADLLTIKIITGLSPNIDFALGKCAPCLQQYDLVPDSRPMILLISETNRRDTLKRVLQPDQLFSGNVKKKKVVKKSMYYL